MQYRMSDGSLILVYSHPNRLLLFLIMATLLLNKNLICYAEEVTCATLGCYTNLHFGKACQCNSACHDHEDCCDDFVDCESCEENGCGLRYDEDKLCQCNDRCQEFGNCCSDYKKTCEPSESSTSNASFTPEGSKALAILLPTSTILVVIVSVTVIILCVVIRRKSRRTTEEKTEERNYYEIGSSDGRPYEGVPRGDDVRRYERDVRYHSSSSYVNGNGGQFVENVAYESYK